MKIKPSVSKCCQIINADDLLNSEYELLSTLIGILKKYKTIVEMLERSDCPLSKVIPSLMSLKLFLQSNQDAKIQEFKSKLLSDFETRFAYIFDINSYNFSRYFLIATALDIKECDCLMLPHLKYQKEFIHEFLHRNEF